jgi:hypothetical protein
VQAVRIIGAVLGGLVVVGTAASVLQTLVTPGGRVGRLFRTVDRGTDTVFRMAVHPLSDFHQRYRILVFQAPIELGIALLSWLVLFLIAYGLILWPMVGTLAGAFREAGSSLFTLGFAATGAGGPTAIDFIAGVTGLAVVAMLIGYLPTLYSAFNRRETEVTLLTVRAGTPAWGPELLARSRYTITIGELPLFYRQWERWAADVAESHSSYPILLRFRSPHVKANWLVALLAVMDSAALWSAVSPDDLPIQGRLCLAMGFRALRQLATTVGIPFEEDPRPDAGTQLTRAEFDQGVARLEQVGFPMTRTPDEAWPHFQGWRVNYESIVYRMAWVIDAVPAAWSGPRRSGEAPIFPIPVVNRTPEHPEGAPVGFRPAVPAESRRA